MLSDVKFTGRLIIIDFLLRNVTRFVLLLFFATAVKGNTSYSVPPCCRLLGDFPRDERLRVLEVCFRLLIDYFKIRDVCGAKGGTEGCSVFGTML